MRDKDKVLTFRVNQKELNQINAKEKKSVSEIWEPIFAKWQWTDTV